MDHEIDPKWSQNASKIEPIWSQIETMRFLWSQKVGTPQPKSSELNPMHRFWNQKSRKWLPNPFQNNTKNWLKIDHEIDAKWMFAFEHDFWEIFMDFWCQNDAILYPS